MPMYSYKCPVCSAGRDILKPIAEIDRTEHCHKCNFAMNRQVVAPRVRPDLPGYACPVTGAWIEGRRQHEENLARTGCRLLEPGESDTAMRKRREADEQFLETVAETAVAEVHNMPAVKREKLCAELEGGLGLAVERSTPNL